MSEEYKPEIFDKMGVHTEEEAKNRICECGHTMFEHKFFEAETCGAALVENDMIYLPEEAGTCVFNDGCRKCDCMEYRQTLR